MDLLFKNPVYFFRSYFSIPIWLFILTFVTVFFFTCLYDWTNRTWKLSSVLYRITWSLCVTIILGTCLLNQSRHITRKLVLNPLPGLEMVCQGNIHWIRQVSSNFILYLPFGFVSEKRVKLIQSTIGGLILSMIVEIMQFIFYRGTSEVLDVVVNTLGACSGACIALMVRRIKVWTLESLKPR